MKTLLSAVGVMAFAASLNAARADEDHHIRHVLLISIDGMHALDFANCANGLPSVNNGAAYCPNLAALRNTGVEFANASTSKPSDSFPGIMALVSGGSPRTVGAYYDVAYDRFLAPPALTTGNGVAGDPNACSPGQAAGTRTEYEEGVDLDQSQLNGGAPNNADGGIASIDPRKLPRDPAKSCAPVYPWNFVRANTIFGVVHAAGGYTAWADKHPAYSAVGGPSVDGGNVDDYYSPEINSTPGPLKGVSTGELDCSSLPDTSANFGAWTDSFKLIQCYDQLKVDAILNQIDHKTHNGARARAVPNLFGMNFQAVSVGQKLIEKSLNMKGGYLDNIGTPSDALLSEIKFVDAAIGRMVAELKKTGDYYSTLLVITAKHGQSPIDSRRYTGITQSGPVTTSPATILDNAGCLPWSEAPSNANGIGPTEDDVSLIWLNDKCTTAQAVALLEAASPPSSNVAGIGEILSGPAIAKLYNTPGLPPQGDPRTPDIIVTPNIGVTYSGSGKKQAEHGGFAHDDTNVIMLLSNPVLRPATLTTPVSTMQVAPTILKVLGLNPKTLQSVVMEGTETLPGVFSE